MKAKLFPFILTFCLFFTIFGSAAEYPSIEKYVNDFAGVLTTAQVVALNEACHRIDLNTSYEVAIVTLNTTGGEDTVLYANHLGEAAGVGKAETDNGIIILWSMQEGGAIAVGRGAESILNDAKVGRIGRASRHYFDEKDYYSGFATIVSNLSAELSPQAAATNINFPWWVWLLILGGIGLFIFIIAVSTSGDSNGGSYGGTTYVGRSYGGGGFSSGGSSGGGFGGFGGGGSFGGGGGKF